jgi:hypothetical protein
MLAVAELRRGRTQPGKRFEAPSRLGWPSALAVTGATATSDLHLVNHCKSGDWRGKLSINVERAALRAAQALFLNLKIRPREGSLACARGSRRDRAQQSRAASSPRSRVRESPPAEFSARSRKCRPRTGSADFRPKFQQPKSHSSADPLRANWSRILPSLSHRLAGRRTGRPLLSGCPEDSWRRRSPRAGCRTPPNSTARC